MYHRDILLFFIVTRYWALLLGGFIFLAALLYAGQGDYDEAVLADTVYNQNVCNGVWPDYENRKPDCK